jgi:DNA primase
MHAHEVKEYYRQITAVDIGEVARAVWGDRITEERGSVLYIDCPHHQSVSGTSLHVECDTQLWRCWGCGISGDVLQLVEFARHGVVTSGIAGEMTVSHRDARDWLAERAGLPKLAHLGLSAAEVASLEQREVTLQRAQAVLTAAAGWYHVRLMDNAPLKAWLQQQYAFDDAMLATHAIGFADLHGLRDHLYGLGFTPEELLASGLFRPNDAGDESKVLPFFNQRVMFPYRSRGRVTYFIGRKCPLTPDVNWERSKYKKLPTHDPEQRPWIAEGIENNQLFNEDCVLARPRQVIITEGITDCLAVMARGFPCISPVAPGHTVPATPWSNQWAA